MALFDYQKWHDRFVEHKTSAVSLVVANAIALLGVIFLGWSWQLILLAYWAESAIIGFFNVIKICAARIKPRKYKDDHKTAQDYLDELKEQPSQPRKESVKRVLDETKESGFRLKAKEIFAKIFIGGFVLIVLSGVMIMSFSLITLITSTNYHTQVPSKETLPLTPLSVLENTSILIIALVVSHLISFIVNFIGKKEYTDSEMRTLFIAPFIRAGLLQLSLIVGMIFVLAIGALLNSIASLMAIPAILLIVIKTIADLGGHLQERAYLND